MNEWSKVVVLAYIGEKVVANMDKNRMEYQKSKCAVDFCWGWIENREADEDLIYGFLDDVNEDDFVGYIINAGNEEDKNDFSTLLGVVSYISYHYLTYNNLPCPQYLELGEDYYDMSINESLKYGIPNCTKEDLDRVIAFCENRIAMGEERFSKEETMNL